MFFRQSDQRSDTPPWYGRTDLPTVLDNVEAVARRHGFQEKRTAQFSTKDLKGVQQRIGVSIPLDLQLFLSWYDRALWSFFVNPARLRLSDSNIYSAKGGRIVRGHPDDRIDDRFGIDSLAEIELVIPSTDRSIHMTNFIEGLPVSGRPPAWALSPLLAFDSSNFGERIFYCIDPPEFEKGAIVSSTMDDPALLWLADSLSEWLARLFACDGTEYAFAPGSVDDLPKPIRRHYIAEFRQRNPRSTFFR